jgi:hypothetical protein
MSLIGFPFTHLCNIIYLRLMFAEFECFGNWEIVYCERLSWNEMKFIIADGTEIFL